MGWSSGGPPPRGAAESASNYIDVSPPESRTLSPFKGVGFKHAFLLHLSLLKPHLFHKLVLQGLKAVKTGGGHVPVLHGDRPLGGLVLAQEGEVLQQGVQLEDKTGDFKVGRIPSALASEKNQTPKMTFDQMFFQEKRASLFSEWYSIVVQCGCVRQQSSCYQGCKSVKCFGGGGALFGLCFGGV